MKESKLFKSLVATFVVIVPSDPGSCIRKSGTCCDQALDATSTKQKASQRILMTRQSSRNNYRCCKV